MHSANDCFSVKDLNVGLILSPWVQLSRKDFSRSFSNLRSVLAGRLSITLGGDVNIRPGDKNPFKISV